MPSPLAAASAALLSAAWAASPPPAAPPAALEVRSTGTPGQAAAVRTQRLGATVRSVDRATRTLALEVQGGGKQSLRVSPEVGLEDVAVGDAVTIELQQQLVLEAQAPGTPTVEFAVADKVGDAPGGGAATGLQATLTVTAVDPKTRAVTFKDPAGATYDVKAGPGLKLEKVKAGDRFLATFVEAMAVRLERPAGKP